MVFFVERDLELATPFCLGNCPLHGVGHVVGIEHDLRVHVPGSPADDLDKAPCVTEETFLVGIEDPDETHFRNIEPFPEKVDAHKDIELAKPELPDDLAALEGLDL